tara:strand:- start:1555 stop:1743 length:189 start_codon:yes stop_codon:yes gene_type:complete
MPSKKSPKGFMNFEVGSKFTKPTKKPSMIGLVTGLVGSTIANKKEKLSKYYKGGGYVITGRN